VEIEQKPDEDQWPGDGDVGDKREATPSHPEIYDAKHNVKNGSDSFPSPGNKQYSEADERRDQVPDQSDGDLPKTLVFLQHVHCEHAHEEHEEYAQYSRSPE
jgi:hypothetical protein